MHSQLGYGVMVTLQILVLSFQVRILVAQQNQAQKGVQKGHLFVFGYYGANLFADVVSGNKKMLIYQLFALARRFCNTPAGSGTGSAQPILVAQTAPTIKAQ